MLDIYFLTSSRAKFDHIKYLLRGLAINVKPQSEYGKAYTEPRIFNRDELLEASIKDANTRLAKKIRYGIVDNTTSDKEDPSLTIDELALRHQEKLFIIEDTSVRIDALSEKEEFPGVDIKHWMKTINFEELDRQLRKKNNRKATVRSDIVIYLPPYFRDNKDKAFFKVFTGESRGSIVERESTFNTNPLYPWLDNKTFNKWFIPEGENKPISLLPIEVANKYDFRKKAIDQLVDYLKEHAFTTLIQPPHSRTPFQTDFFDKSSLIVCGPTCAGKTVLAEFLAKKYGHYHIEASDFMHLAYYRKHGFTSSVNIHDFALNALTENPSIVSTQIKDHLDLVGDSPFIITGFRSLNELNIFSSIARKFHHLYIEADISIRFSRNTQRARLGHAKNFEEFQSQDQKQIRMGIKDIRTSEHFKVVQNESTKEEFFNNIVSNYFFDTESNTTCIDDFFSLLKGSNLSLEESILLALYIESKKNFDYFTTTEIAKLINTSLYNYRHHQQSLIKTDKNNVSRYFNQRLYPYYDVAVPEKTAKFRLSTTGISHAKHTLKQISVRRSNFP